MSDEELFTDIESLIETEARRIADETLRPEDITIRRIMDRHRVSENQARQIARNVLDPLVEAGKLIKLHCMNPSGGGKVDTWRAR